MKKKDKFRRRLEALEGAVGAAKDAESAAAAADGNQDKAKAASRWEQLQIRRENYADVLADP